MTDDEQVRMHLLDAAEKCIARKGDTQIRMVEVADAAAVARSTLYRYFAARDELLLALVVRRVDRAAARWVAELRRPGDAAASIRELVLKPVASVEGDPVNLALYSGGRGALVSVLDDGAEQIADVMIRHVGALFKQWKAEGQLYRDLDLRETLQWMSATSSFLLTTHWRHRPPSAHRRFVDRYLLRALVP